jgi:hypothetical protein
VIGFGTVVTHTPIVERSQQRSVSVRLNVYLLRAQLHALATGNAIRVAVDAELPQLVTVARRTQSHLWGYFGKLRRRGEILARLRSVRVVRFGRAHIFTQGREFLAFQKVARRCLLQDPRRTCSGPSRHASGVPRECPWHRATRSTGCTMRPSN